MSTGLETGSQGVTQLVSKANLNLMSSSACLGPHSYRVLKYVSCIFYLDNDRCNYALIFLLYAFFVLSSAYIIFWCTRSTGKKTCSWEKKALIYHMWHYDDGEENNCYNQTMVKLPGLKRTDRESSGGRVS